MVKGRVFNMSIKNIVWNNHRGFTLIEAMLHMLILSIIMSLIPLIMYYLSSVDRIMSVQHDYEWNLFLINFRHEIADADPISVYRQRVLASKNEQVTYRFEVYGTVLRKRVNNTGHEVILQNIRDAAFIKFDDHFTFEVEFLDGTKEKAIFLLPEQKQGQVE